jgi:hypothetical protein
VPDPEPPEAEIDEAAAEEPAYTSDDSYLDATAKLILRKALEDDA